MNKVIEMQHINKKYYEGMENELHILHDIDLTVCDGEFVALVGESGSGKSTMMNIIGALDRPTSGQYFLAGEDISEMDDDRLSEIRNNEIGFVFQSAYMIVFQRWKMLRFHLCMRVCQEVKEETGLWPSWKW